MDAGVRELHRLEKLCSLASLGRRFLCKSCPSTSATLSPLVAGEAFRPANRLSPAGPPPTHTTSYNSGTLAAVDANLRCSRVLRVLKHTAGVGLAARCALQGIRGGIGSLFRQVAWGEIQLAACR